MLKAIRLQSFQSLANYRKPSSFITKETYPLPPYSTVLGMIHAACGYTKFHPMQLSIQGSNSGTISDMYIRYSFSPGGKYEAGRHQICVEDGEKYGIFKGVAYTELVCDSQLLFHIIPEEEDFEAVYQALKYPKTYLALGRHEDLVDIQKVEIVELEWEEEAEPKYNIYVPMNPQEPLEGVTTTIYTLTREYEITPQGMRRWKQENGKVRAYYFQAGMTLGDVYVDTYGDVAVFA